MRSQLFVGGVASIGLLLAVAACSSGSDGTTGAGPGAEDGGSSGSSGKTPGSSSGSSGDPDPEKDAGGGKKDGGSDAGSDTLKSDTLAQGDQQLIGLVGNDAIYIDFDQEAVFAVPINGSGTSTKISDLDLFSGENAIVNGGAVAVWTNVDADGFGTLGVWTRATGMKNSIATKSGIGGFFRASEDGTRIAFTQNLALDANDDIPSLEVGVRDTTATTNAATLSGTTASGNAFNFVAAQMDCPVAMGFSGKVFFAQFCTGTDATATDAKLVTVAGNGTSVVRLDAASDGAAGTLKGNVTFTTDTAGTKVFVVKSANSAGGFITVGTATFTAFDNNVAEGTMLPDASAAIYRTTGNVLVKATTGATPAKTTLVAANAKGILGVSPDAKNILFNKLDPQGNFGLVDINVIDHTVASPAAVALVSTSTALPIGINGANSHLVFMGDLTNTSAKLSSIPVVGGTTVALGDTQGALVTSVGTGALSISNVQDEPGGGNFTISDLTHYDTVTGKSSKIADSVPEGEIQMKEKRVVYTRFSDQAKGVYAVTLP